VTEWREPPYPGLRPYRAGERLYGRDREKRDLFHLLMARRIVLLYAPSGAGKTSLIQADLIKRLRGNGLHVFPILRVAAEPIQEGDAPAGVNPYLFRLLSTLEEDLELPDRRQGADPAKLSLEEYLEQRLADSESRFSVLIFDQFEEILTLNPVDYDAKVGFFQEVGRALQNNRRLWALFVIRQEFLAGLDPYLGYIPTRLANRYPIDFLGPQAALDAIEGPAREAKVPFDEDVAETLRDELLKVRFYGPDGTLEEKKSQYVEPGILQVVCRRLWCRLAPDATRIAEADVAALGSLDNAMADYYDEQVAAARQATGVSERKIRGWIDKNLISKGGVRLPVLREEPETRGLSNEVFEELEKASLVRTEMRRGLRWHELAHDRWIRPIQESNRKWRESSLSLLQKEAQIWFKFDRSDDYLLRGQPLSEAERWAEAHPEDMREDRLATEFLKLSRDRRTVRWTTRTLVGVLLVNVLLLVMFAGYSLAREHAKSVFKANSEINAAATARAADEYATATDLASRSSVATAQAAEAAAKAMLTVVVITREAVSEAAFGLESSDAATARADVAAAGTQAAVVATSAYGELAAAESARATAAAQQQLAQAQQTSVAQAALTLQPPAEVQETPEPTELPRPTSSPTPTPTPTPAPPTAIPIDRSPIARLSDDPAQEYTPSYSPDGSQIVYQSDRDGTWQIYLMNADGGEVRRLSQENPDRPNVNYLNPRFLPNGEQIAFGSNSDGDYDLYLMDLEGNIVDDGNLTNDLEGEPRDQYYPRFSGDGRLMAFMSKIDEDDWDIYIMNLGSRAIALTSEDFLYDLPAQKGDFYPAFHPDPAMHSLVFQSDRHGNWDIYKLDLDSRRVERLTADLGRDAQPDVDPQGMIVWESKRSGNYDLWQMYWDGSEKKQLTTHPADDQIPAFAHDGSRIIFQSMRDGNWNLFAVVPNLPTPTPTPTPTVNRPATLTVEAADTQSAGVQTRQAVIAACKFEPQGAFSEIWRTPEILARLGCPKQANPASSYFAEQRFGDRGTMYWSQLHDRFFVLMGQPEADGGASLVLPSGGFDINPSGVSCAPSVTPVPGEAEVQPVRGFGGLWCAELDVQRALGFATEQERGVTGNLIQEFDGGQILRDSRGDTYVIYSDATYERIAPEDLATR